MLERGFLAHARRISPAGALALSVLGGALGATIVAPPAPRLVWNVSASAPLGLYLVGDPDDARVGDMVIARVPAPWRRLAAMRHYLPANVPLVKRVVAGTGDTVCACGKWILVNGRRVAERRPVDGRGQQMPRWSGCVRLGEGALFLLMEDPASFDGRYFGPTQNGDIIGGAKLIWRA